MGIVAILRRLFKRPGPTHCACGREAIVTDHERPWIGLCGRCYLRSIGKL